MDITVPELSLVGASGSGKSTLARRHFKATEVLSSDECRALVSDDENDLTVTKKRLRPCIILQASGGSLHLVPELQPGVRDVCRTNSSG